MSSIALLHTDSVTSQAYTLAALARAITWAGSKQTYCTARLMVDKDLVDDFFRAYAYFRWADDVVDAPCGSDEERVAFMARQRELIDRLAHLEVQSFGQRVFG